MTDDRPVPQYGEYATPEQQAAAMGRKYTPPPAPETRVSVPGAPTPGQPGAGQPGSGQPGSGQQGSGQQAPEQPFRIGGNLIDRFVSIFQLGIGLVLLLSSDYFHLGENANTDLSEVGLTEKIPVAIDHYGWLILGANIVLLLATIVWVYARLRRGRLAFYIPAVGYLAFSAFLGLLISVVQ
jgi:hypothetical protein